MRKFRTRMPERATVASLAAGILVAMSCAGCESLQRKFTRKSKTPPERPNPVIHFQDYSKDITPLDLYRKHFLMYEYWEADLVESMTTSRFSIKRVRHASSGALDELTELRKLVPGASGERLQALLAERMQVHRRLQGPVSPAQVDAVRRQIEAQSRAIHREFSWRKVDDLLQASAASPSTSPASASPVAVESDAAVSAPSSVSSN